MASIWSGQVDQRETRLLTRPSWTIGDGERLLPPTRYMKRPDEDLITREIFETSSSASDIILYSSRSESMKE